MILERGDVIVIDEEKVVVMNQIAPKSYIGIGANFSYVEFTPNNAGDACMNQKFDLVGLLKEIRK